MNCAAHSTLKPTAFTASGTYSTDGRKVRMWGQNQLQGGQAETWGLDEMVREGKGSTSDDS